MMATNNVTELGSLLKNAMITLTKTIKSGVVAIDTKSIFVNAKGYVQLFLYPYLKRDKSVDAIQNTSETNERSMLQIIGRIARDSHPSLSVYQQNGNNVSTFSYATTALLQCNWNCSLAEQISLNIDDGAKVAIVANCALMGGEQNNPDPRWQQLKQRAGVRVDNNKADIQDIIREFKINYHQPRFANNVNANAAKSVSDVEHHLFDYETYRDMVTSRGRDVTLGNIVADYLEHYPFFRFHLFEVYADTLGVLLKNDPF